MASRLIIFSISPILIGTNISTEGAVAAVTLHSSGNQSKQNNSTRPVSKAALAARRCAARRGLRTNSHDGASSARFQERNPKLFGLLHESKLELPRESECAARASSKFSAGYSSNPIVLTESDAVGHGWANTIYYKSKDFTSTCFKVDHRNGLGHEHKALFRLSTPGHPNVLKLRTEMGEKGLVGVSVEDSGKKEALALEHVSGTTVDQYIDEWFCQGRCVVKGKSKAESLKEAIYAFKQTFRVKSWAIFVAVLTHEGKTDLLHETRQAVISAIVHMHSRGVVHNDLHASNVMLRGDEKNAVVIDFDSAGLFSGADELLEYFDVFPSVKDLRAMEEGLKVERNKGDGNFFDTKVTDAEIYHIAIECGKNIDTLTPLFFNESNTLVDSIAISHLIPIILNIREDPEAFIEKLEKTKEATENIKTQRQFIENLKQTDSPNDSSIGSISPIVLSESDIIGNGAANTICKSKDFGTCLKINNLASGSTIDREHKALLQIGGHPNIMQLRTEIGDNGIAAVSLTSESSASNQSNGDNTEAFDIQMRNRKAMALERVHGQTVEGYIENWLCGNANCENNSSRESVRNALAEFTRPSSQQTWLLFVAILTYEGRTDLLTKIRQSVFSAIMHMHSRGVLHDDLHAGNVMLEGAVLDENGQHGHLSDSTRAVVIDFDTAQVFPSENQLMEVFDKRFTRVGTLKNIADEMKLNKINGNFFDPNISDIEIQHIAMECVNTPALTPFFFNEKYSGSKAIADIIPILLNMRNDPDAFKQNYEQLQNLEREFMDNLKGKF